MRALIFTALKASISAGLIYYLFDRIDTAHAFSLIAAIPPMSIAAAILLSAFQGFLIAARWGAVLQAITAPLRFGKRIAFVFIGLFFNQVLPSSIGGDAVRMYAANRAGLHITSAINGVMLERLVAVISLVLTCLVFTSIFQTRTQQEIPPVAIFAVIAATLSGLATLAFLDRFPERLRTWRLIRGLAALAKDFRAVFFHLPALAHCLLWGFVGNLNISLTIWMLAHGLGLGDTVSLLDCIVLAPPVILISSLPLSIGGWGVREGAMVVVLALIGVPSEAAIALSLLFGLSATAVAVLGGVAAFMKTPGFQFRSAGGKVSAP